MINVPVTPSQAQHVFLSQPGDAFTSMKNQMINCTFIKAISNTPTVTAGLSS